MAPRGIAGLTRAVLALAPPAGAPCGPAAWYDNMLTPAAGSLGRPGLIRGVG
jgi:hypothetical protein